MHLEVPVHEVIVVARHDKSQELRTSGRRGDGAIRAWNSGVSAR